MSKKIPGIEVIRVILTSCYQKKKNHLTTPPPTECGRLLMVMGEAEKFLLLPPPPQNLPGLRRSRKISATTPPPTESGRPPEITEHWPPQKKKKSWLRRWFSCPIKFTKNSPHWFVNALRAPVLAVRNL